MKRYIPPEMRQRSHLPLPFFFLVIAISSIPLLCANIYLPSLPTIAKDLNVSDTLVTWTITSYLLAFGFSSLFAGTIIDVFGRRRPVICGMAIFLLGVIICSLTRDIYMLIAGRILQGLGGSIMPIAMRAVLRDRLKDKPFIIMIGWMGIMMCAAPMLGPLIGVFVMNHFGWRANFYVMELGLFFLMLTSLFFLKESYHYSKRIPLEWPVIFSTMRRVAGSLDIFYVVMPIAVTLLYSSYMVTVLPFAVRDAGYPDMYMTYFLLINVVMMIIGRYMGVYLLRCYSERTLWLRSAWATAFSGVLFLPHVFGLWTHPLTFIAPIFLSSFAISVMSPMSNKGVMSVIPNAGGMSAAYFMFAMLVFQALGAWMCGFVFKTDLPPLRGLAVTAVLCLLSVPFFALRSARSFRYERY